MRTQLAHLQINVRAGNLPFYKELFGFMGWAVVYEGEGMLGVADRDADSLWFAGQAMEVANDYDGPGVNHLGIGAEAQADVDAVAAYLAERGVAHLFETPRHRPDFCGSDDETYYQVMFESPDRILFEVVYTGRKSA